VGLCGVTIKTEAPFENQCLLNVHCRPQIYNWEKHMLWVSCTVLVLLAGLYVLRPLFSQSKDSLDIELLDETELDRLSDRKAVVYSNLGDLEFEHKMGRLSETDFRQLEEGYKKEAADIMQSLDELSVSENLDDEIEKDIAARKSKMHLPDTKTVKVSSRCPSCGAEVSPGKKYCADCGHRL
jgi:hypothetical protein